MAAQREGTHGDIPLKICALLNVQTVSRKAILQQVKAGAQMGNLQVHLDRIHGGGLACSGD